MKNLVYFFNTLAGLTLAACGNQAAEKKEKLAIVTTNSILSDLVKNVGKTKLSCIVLCQLGQTLTNMNRYQKTLRKLLKRTFYSLTANLETGGNGWFNKLMKTAKKLRIKITFLQAKMLRHNI